MSLQVDYALQFNSAPINRIRVVAHGPDGKELGRTVENVPSDAPSWTVALEIEVRSAMEVTLLVELLSVGTVESVEWSGRAGPISVVPGRVHAASVVELGVGPVDNMAVTLVRIAGPVAAMLEGAQAQLSAQVVGGGPSAQAIFSSLNPTIAAVSQRGQLDALLPGSARIVAAAGSRADTVVVDVRQRATRVALTPASAELVSFGAETSFSARVLDPRGADVAGARIVWSSSNANVAGSLGGGRFRANSNGAMTVSAAMEGATSLQASATLTVAQRVATARVSPDTVRLSVSGKATVSAEAKDALGACVCPTTFTWSSSDASVATVDGNGGVTGVKGGTATITATARVGGSAPATEVMTARSVAIVTSSTPVIPNIEGTYDFSGAVDGTAETVGGFFTISSQQGGTAQMAITIVALEPNRPPRLVASNLPGSMTVDAGGNVSGRASDTNGVFTFDGRFLNGVITAGWMAVPTSPTERTIKGSFTAQRR